MIVQAKSSADALLSLFAVANKPADSEDDEDNGFQDAHIQSNALGTNAAFFVLRAAV